MLSWATASEVNTTAFQVLRGNHPNPVEIIGSVSARGNSSVYTPYQFIDKTPLTGTNYYRLKMADKDGKTTYSNTILLKSVENSSGIVIYPNPVTSQLTVCSATGTTIDAVNLYDAKGSVLYSKNKMAVTQTTIHVASFPAGLYTVEVRSGNKVVTEKVNKQ